MPARFAALLMPLAATMAISASFHAQDPQHPAYAGDPELLVRELYQSVSCKEGAAEPDWGKVRAMFHEKAQVFLRTSRTKYEVFDVQGFIRDFQTFYQNPNVRKAGFTETVLNLKKTVMGSIAHILVHYQAAAGPRKNDGVDSWQLVRQGGRWWIFSITNEVVEAESPLPEQLKR